MKKISAFLISILFLVSCTDLDQIRMELDDHESRISALEEICKEINTNLSSLQTIVSALQQGDYVTDVTPVEKGGVVVGYTINFKKNKAITIYHGKDGADGENGASPSVSIRKDKDGFYYWVLDGNWLLDENQNKIPVRGKDGKDGVVPKLKITDGFWYVSYDGTSWIELGKAVCETDGYVFENVEYDEKEIRFVMKDKTVITLPRIAGFKIVVKDDFAHIFPNTREKIHFYIEGTTEGMVIDCISNGNCDASVTMTSGSEGYIDLQVYSGKCKIILLATNGFFSDMLSLNLEQGKLVLEKNRLTVGYMGGRVNLPYQSNCKVEFSVPDDAASWVVPVLTKSQLQEHSQAFDIMPNRTQSQRETEVMINNQKGIEIGKFVIEQSFGDNSKRITIKDFLGFADTEMDYKLRGRVTDIDPVNNAWFDIQDETEILRVYSSIDFNGFESYLKVGCKIELSGFYSLDGDARPCIVKGKVTYIRTDMIVEKVWEKTYGELGVKSATAGIGNVGFSGDKIVTSNLEVLDLEGNKVGTLCTDGVVDGKAADFWLTCVSNDHANHLVASVGYDASGEKFSKDIKYTRYYIWSDGWDKAPQLLYEKTDADLSKYFSASGDLPKKGILTIIAGRSATQMHHCDVFVDGKLQWNGYNTPYPGNDGNWGAIVSAASGDPDGYFFLADSRGNNMGIDVQVRKGIKGNDVQLNGSIVDDGTVAGEHGGMNQYGNYASGHVRAFMLNGRAYAAITTSGWPSTYLHIQSANPEDEDHFLLRGQVWASGSPTPCSAVYTVSAGEVYVLMSTTPNAPMMALFRIY